MNKVDHKQVAGDGGKRRGRAHDGEGRALAEIQQACGLVDLGAGEQHRVDRAAALALVGLQRRCRLDLRAQVG